ncbi:MAG: NusG domain II-containing protein [Tissierellia bacterium]|nr:NusG domain II-containing protein [Tissierellia bacterium]
MVRGDKIVIFIIVCIALGLLGFSKVLITSSPHRYISVQVSGKEVEKLDFEGVKKSKTYQVNTKKGYNIISYNSEGATLIEADCPDQICVKMARISKPGEMIICLPHELVVEVKSSKPGKNDLDSVLR